MLALIFFTLEQGHAFAAETAFWTIPGMCATIPVYLAYLAVARRVREPRLVSIALGALAGFAAFALGVVLIGWLPLTRLMVVPFAASVCFVPARLIRRLPDTAPLVRVRSRTRHRSCACAPRPGCCSSVRVCRR